MYHSRIKEYFSNNKSEILQDNNLDQTDSTVDKISVKNEVKIDSSKNQTNDNDFVASDETFFGYSIFENNPFKNKEYLVVILMKVIYWHLVMN